MATTDFTATRTCLSLVPLLLIALGPHQTSAVNFGSEQPHELVEMLCWEDVLCHTNHTEAIHATLVDDLRRAEPGANDREVAVECARCRRTDVDLVCYRTATRIEHAFLSENTLTELGKREFGKEPSPLCGDSLSYCWGNKTCAENNTMSFREELSANVYESPELNMTCSACEGKEFNISCFTASCVSCFYDENLARILYEGAEIWGRTIPHGETCEDVEFFLTNPLTSHSVLHAPLIFLHTLTALIMGLQSAR